MKVLSFFCVVMFVTLSTAYNVEDSAVETENDKVSEKRARYPPKCPTIVFPCARGSTTMPTVCQNMRNAINKGHPTVLHRTTTAQKNKNRRASGCPKETAKLRKKNKGKKVSKKLSCDEYPFASSQEGGAGAEIMMVPAEENNRQGGLLAGFYRKKKIVVGSCYIVKV